MSAEFVADDNAFSVFKTRFVNQTNHRFRLKYQTAAVIEQQLDSQPRTRSEARALVESFDLAADRLQTSDFRRLSRLHLEDIFCLLPGDPMKMYISHEAAMNQSEWWGGVFTAAISRIHGSSDTTMINGVDYYCFDVNVSHASLHSEMKAGLLTPEQVGTLFSRKNGFSVIIGGHDNLKLTVQWDQVIEYSTSLMFFGPPSTRTRLYSDLFTNLKSIQTIRSVFHWYSHETRGDSMASHALLSSYLNAENRVLHAKKGKKTTKIKLPKMNVETVPQGGSKLVQRVNEDCKTAFQAATRGWTDVQAPLISEAMYDSWVTQAKSQYSNLWKSLAQVRGITGAKKYADLVPGKERQVLNQMLAKFRNRNTKVLTWWSLIETVALLAWSVGTTALNRLNYWGTHLSAATRDSLLAKLFGKEHIESIKNAYTMTKVIIFIIDNYQKGQQLKNQRGKHSSTFLEGTNQIAEKGFLYDNPLFNNIKPLQELLYNGLDIIVSPDGMAKYEDYDGFSPSKYFANHKDLSGVAPDFTGKRVKMYAKLLKLSNTLQVMRSVFCDNTEISPFLPDHVDKTAIQNFRWDCRTKDVMSLFATSKTFQRDAVLKWNPHADEVTPTILIGINPMSEAASMETCAIVLELLVKAGVMTVEDDGKFGIGDLSKFIILAGDVKTVDNLNLIQETIRSSMDGRGFTELNHQLQVFDKVLSRVMDIPGDWHAGLSMLQAIITLFYDSLLYPVIHDMLGWKRFNRETNKCYYVSARAVILLKNVLYRVSFERFIAESHKELKTMFDSLVDNGDMEIGDANFVCFCAEQFQQHLKEELGNSDEWRRACAVFLMMASDFEDHVNAYRKCDAIICELSYQRFAPVWRVVGAKRYLERVWRQSESLYTKFGFKELQIVRINRSSRPYHGSTDKGAHSLDEKMEFYNGDYARFPTPRTLAGFVNHSKSVGLAKKAKNTVVKYYTIKPLRRRKPPRSASSAFDKPQETFIYEFFVRMDTFATDPQRKYSIKTIAEVGKKCTTNLKLSSVEERMVDRREYESDRILSTLHQCFEEKDDVDREQLSPEDAANLEEEDQIDRESMPTAEEEDEQMLGRSNVEIEQEEMLESDAEVSREKGFNVNCITDVWHK
eukprot:scaffold49684_cov59-Cyclotella_meneghiniana.AAC.1